MRKIFIRANKGAGVHACSSYRELSPHANKQTHIRVAGFLSCIQMREGTHMLVMSRTFPTSFRSWAICMFSNVTYYTLYMSPKQAATGELSWSVCLQFSTVISCIIFCAGIPSKQRAFDHQVLHAVRVQQGHVVRGDVKQDHGQYIQCRIHWRLYLTGTIQGKLSKHGQYFFMSFMCNDACVPQQHKASVSSWIMGLS
jgi:hypothetical protein